MGQLTVSWMLRKRSSCRAAFKGAVPASIMALRAAAPLQHCDSISAQAIHSGVVCSGEAATFRVCVSIWAFTYVLRTPLLSRYGSAAQHASHSDGMRGLDVEQPSLRFLGLLTLADWYADWTDVPSIMAGLKCLRTASLSLQVSYFRRSSL